MRNGKLKMWKEEKERRGNLKKLRESDPLPSYLWGMERKRYGSVSTRLVLCNYNCAPINKICSTFKLCGDLIGGRRFSKVSLNRKLLL